VGAGIDVPSCIILTNFESYLSQNYVNKKETLIMLKPTEYQYNIKVKIKQSRNRHGVPQRVPGGLGSHIL
jgi:hypothetical protein